MEAATERAPVALGLKADATTAKDRPLPIIDCFEAARDAKDGRSEARRESWNYFTEMFTKWIAENHAGAKDWRHLTREMLRQYLRSLSGKSENTKRLYCQPITQTSRFASIEYGLPDIGAGLEFSGGLTRTPAKVYLKQVLSFLDWLRDSSIYQRWEAPAALAGLAGLRVTEVLRLTWSKIDLKRGLVAVSGETKNEQSERLIPVPKRIVEALQRAKPMLDKRKVRAADDLLVAGLTGEALTDYRSYTRLMKRAMARWEEAQAQAKWEASNPEGEWEELREADQEVLIEKARVHWAPKDLRNCIITLAKISVPTFDGTMLEQYVGHAAKDVSGRHYTANLADVSDAEKEVQEAAMDLFRASVVARIEAEITRIYNMPKDQVSQNYKNQASA